MIYKNREHNGIIIPTAFYFGRADITVTAATAKDYAAVLFKNEKRDYVGQILENEEDERSTEAWAPDAMMFFDNVASIDVVLHFLNEAKAHLIKIQNGDI